MTSDSPLTCIPSGSLYVSRADFQEVTLAPPPIVRITGTNSQPLVTIHPDGRTEFGEDYQPDAAAQAFWAAVRHLAPSPMVQQFGRPLTARINAELARGQAAEDLLRTAVQVFQAVHGELVDGHPFGELQDCAVCHLVTQIRALLPTPAARPR